MMIGNARVPWILWLLLASCCCGGGSSAGAGRDAGVDSDGEPPAVDGSASPKPAFLWGTEIGASGLTDATSLPEAVAGAAEVVDELLQVRYVKLRHNQPFGLDGQPVSSGFSPRRCIARGRHLVGDHPECSGNPEVYDIDAIAALFAMNGWSMVPMLTHAKGSPGSGSSRVTDEDIASYVAYVEWFVGRYQQQANIRYVELINAPMISFNGTPTQLLDASNRAYDRLKASHPGISVGTPGFECFNDRPDATDSSALAQIDHFLDPAQEARFDFWALHGYPARRGPAAALPPTVTPLHNPLANVAGLLELRGRLDARGWQDRPIIDVEHTGVLPLDQVEPTAEQERLDAAYMVQQLLLKRTLQHDGRPVLAGALPLKIRRRGVDGESPWASLRQDGSPTLGVVAVAVLRDQIGGLAYAGRPSGALDAPDPWVERFDGADRTVHVLFDPFNQQGGALALDAERVAYRLELDALPSAVKLVDIEGNTATLPAARTIELELHNAPQYLVAYR